MLCGASAWTGSCRRASLALRDIKNEHSVELTADVATVVPILVADLSAAFATNDNHTQLGAEREGPAGRRESQRHGAATHAAFGDRGAEDTAPPYEAAPPAADVWAVCPLATSTHAAAAVDGIRASGQLVELCRSQRRRPPHDKHVTVI